MKANQGAAGVDGQSIAEFEANLSGNLYKLWNRLSSGSYFPPPVRRVDIPKARWRHAAVGHSDGRRPHRPGGRPPLPGADPGAGVPCRLLRLQARQVCDRCRAHGSRALLALRLGARSRHQGLLRQHRLGADAQGRPATYGLSLGAALHRALAEGARADGGWQHRAAHGGDAAGRGDLAAAGEPVPALRVRHVDGAGRSRTSRSSATRTTSICHCRSAEEARALWSALADRFAACKLVLHPEKTKIVYCKDVNRRGDFPDIHFDFLGFQFRARKTMWRERRTSASSRTASSPPPARRR